MLRRTRKGSITSVIFIVLALFMFALLIFIYFGHTGFFQRIYKITDKLGITNLAQSVKMQEENIIASREANLTPEEKAAEEQIKGIVGQMSAAIESCVRGSSCVCQIPLKLIPQGYIMRFVNDKANNKVYLSVYQVKERNWGFDYGSHFWGQTGVRIVPDATHVFQGTQSCLVNDIEKNIIGNNAVQVHIPISDMIQIYPTDSGTYRASEATSVSMSFERDYTLYGQSGDSISLYITRKMGKNFCFFAQRADYPVARWINDKGLVKNIDCNQDDEKQG